MDRDSWNGDHLLSVKQLCAVTSWSRTSVYRLLEKDENFPKRVRLGKQRIAFRGSDVSRYMDSLKHRD